MDSIAYLTILAAEVTGLPALLIILTFLALLVYGGVIIGRRTKE